VGLFSNIFGSKKKEEFQEGATGELLEFLHVFFPAGCGRRAAGKTKRDFGLRRV